jgi:histidine triad (HIT) family protein
MKIVTDCILCGISSHKAKSHILYESEQVIAVLDLYPATRGHTLILPKYHIPTICGMPLDTGMEIMKTAIDLAKAIKLALHPEGLNLIQANGVAGGQTIDHFHLHIVPRYGNDGVVLRFGHGSQSANSEELAKVASIIRL